MIGNELNVFFKYYLSVTGQLDHDKVILRVSYFIFSTKLFHLIMSMRILENKRYYSCQELNNTVQESVGITSAFKVCSVFQFQ